MTVKVIPTVYNGTRYRSRTEARWAIFFDLIGLWYRYEDEGFATKEGAYLPDFVLRFGDRKVFFEVKGDRPDKREVNLALALAREANTHVLIACGAPSRTTAIAEINRDGQVGRSTFPKEWEWALDESGGYQFPIHDEGPIQDGGRRQIADLRSWRERQRSGERKRGLRND